MYLIATFSYSIALELAITELEKKGVAREMITAVPIDKRSEATELFDTLDRADSVSLFDGTAALASLFALIGVVYGFVLHWGPIIWGINGGIIGGILGYLLDTHYHRPQQIRAMRGGNQTEVVLIVECATAAMEKTESILWKSRALGVGRLLGGE